MPVHRGAEEAGAVVPERLDAAEKGRATITTEDEESRSS
jgi:hypothetical protein